MPGTSGVLSPFCKIKGFTFNESIEPDNFMYEFSQDIKDILNEEGVSYVDISFKNKEDYYKVIRELHAFNENNIKVSVKLKNEDDIIFEQDELDLTGNKAEYRQKSE